MARLSNVYLDFMAPFIGAEQGRAENDRIEQYRLNKEAANLQKSAYRDAFEERQNNRLAANYLGNLPEIYRRLVNKGVAPEEILKGFANQNLTEDNPTFAALSPTAKLKIFDVFSKFATAAGANYNTAGQTNTANNMTMAASGNPLANPTQNQAAQAGYQAALDQYAALTKAAQNPTIGGLPKNLMKPIDYTQGQPANTTTLGSINQLLDTLINKNATKIPGAK